MSTKQLSIHDVTVFLISLTSYLCFLVPPSIMSEPRSGNVTVRKGTTVSLECKANGNPTPTVSWTRISHKRHRSIPDKDLTNHGMILTLDNVGRRDAGKYQCTATNGVGKDAVKYIHVSVLCEYQSRKTNDWI